MGVGIDDKPQQQEDLGEGEAVDPSDSIRLQRAS